MLQQSIPASRAAEAAQLQSAVEQFLAQGNAIEQVAGFKYEPIRPERIPAHPEQARLAELRSLARSGCTRRYIALCMNMTPGQVDGLARRNGVRFRGKL